EDGESARIVTPFDVSVAGTPTHPHIVVRGELDVATSPGLRSTLNNLLDRGATELTLDFAGVSFVDSSGLGGLVGTYKRLQEDGSGTIRIVGTQASVRKVFQITGLHDALLHDGRALGHRRSGNGTRSP